MRIRARTTVKTAAPETLRRSAPARPPGLMTGRSNSLFRGRS
ncbi:hypothetical protein [Rubrobacter marinus]|nr:hypothetical protein [Rubrobacter marinus]